MVIIIVTYFCGFHVAFTIAKELNGNSENEENVLNKETSHTIQRYVLLID